MNIAWLANTKALTKTISRQQIALLYAVTCGVICVLRDATLLRTFSFLFGPDSDSYINFYSIRSLPYPLMNWFVNAPVNPNAIIWLQIIVAAFAVGSVLYIVGKKHLVFALLLGVLFVLNVLWASTNIVVLTESPTMSFCLLSLALLINQYERRANLHWWELIGAAFIYGWTFMLRPSGLFLVVPLFLGYALFTRSWRKIAQFGTGLVLFFLCYLLANLLIYNQVVLVSDSGYFEAFPLLSYQLFSPENGPNSMALDSQLKQCDPSLDYTKINVSTSNDYFWGKFLPCLNSHGWDSDKISTKFSGAYVEGIRHNPLLFAEQLYKNTAYMLSFTPAGSLSFAEGTNVCPTYSWCDEMNNRSLQYPAGRTEVANDILSIKGVNRWLSQLYLAISIPFTERSYPDLSINYSYSPWNGLVVVLWLAQVGLTMLLVRGSLRLLVFASFAFVQYTILSVVAGHVFVGRYAIPLSPFYEILTLAFVTGVLSRLGELSAGLKKLWMPLTQRQRVTAKYAFLAMVAAAITVVISNALAISLVNQATAQWISDHVADSSRIIVEKDSAPIFDPVQSLGSKHLDVRTVPDASEKPMNDWLNADLAHYIVIDQRTPSNESFAQRVQNLVDTGGILLYTSQNLLGLGAQRAILWTFQPQHMTNVTFDNSLTLVGYNVNYLQNGDVSLLMHWYTAHPSTHDYQIFLHVVDSQTGKLIGQADTALGKGLHPTSTWRNGELVFEDVVIPASSFDGHISTCVIQIGLYELANGARAKITDVKMQPAEDHFEIRLHVTTF